MMFIGGASGSTAGGIKVNTFSVLLIAIVSTVRGRPSAEALGRRIPHEIVYRALSVALLSIAFIFVVALSLELTTPPTIPFVAIVFESISAFATVGASTGITPELPPLALVPADPGDVRRPPRATHAGPGARGALAPTCRTAQPSRRCASDEPRYDPLSGGTPAMKPSVLVVGLGRFGTAAALELMALGHEVLALDRDEATVNEIAPEVTHAAQLDATDEGALRSVGAGDFEFAIVAISSATDASIFATMALKNLGVTQVIAKAATTLHGAILERIGADRVDLRREGDGRAGRAFADHRRRRWTTSTWPAASGSSRSARRPRGWAGH